MTDLLAALRALDLPEVLGPSMATANEELFGELRNSGVRFVSSNPRLTERYYAAVRELFSCIAPMPGTGPILKEGGVYDGCWLESTGTINAELLSRFLPSVAASTYAAFATHQRDDGLFPYKITSEGPAFAQIQTVTPLARSVWNHFRLNGSDRAWLQTLYEAIARNDAWLAKHRDTLGTGAVEAFCAFDTGHDLSSRFWHIPDSPYGRDPKHLDPDNPLLPLIAPDLTANVACQRHYLVLIAEALGEDGVPWRDKAEASRSALFFQCWDDADGFFYDRDRHGRLHRIQSDVLLRVLACEIGNAQLFKDALSGYLLNSRKFFAKFPPTSLALDDPRFDPNFGHNSWNGPTNFLSLIRTPHAFEHHGHDVELTWFMQPALTALFAADRFPQTLSPYSGAPGFTEQYAPAILCLLDFVERLCGILPHPDGTIRVTGLLPKPMLHHHAFWETAYARTVDGIAFELVNTSEGSTLYRNGDVLCRFPTGLRLFLDRAGDLLWIEGLSARPISGTVDYDGRSMPFDIKPNQRLAVTGSAFEPLSNPGLILPTT